MTNRPHFEDGAPLSDREGMSLTLQSITEQEFTHEELTTLLRAVTGWNRRTCARFASEALPLDQRRRDMLATMLQEHQDHMKAFETWLRSL